MAFLRFSSIYYNISLPAFLHIIKFSPFGRGVRVTIHGALHLAARHPANKVLVSGIWPLAEGNF